MKTDATRTAGSLLLVILCLGLLSASRQFQKSDTRRAEHPFKSKMIRHQHNEATEAERAMFRKEIASLASKVTTIKSRAEMKTTGPALSPDHMRIQRLQEISAGTLNMIWAENGSVPIFIQGQQLQNKILAKGSHTSLSAAESQAAAFLEENRRLLRIAQPSEELHLIENGTDRYGLTHFRYQQTYKGLEVWGRDVRVHLNKDGLVDSFNGRYIPTPQLISVVNPAISESAAENIARQHFQKPVSQQNIRKLIYVDDLDQVHVAWLVQLRGGLADNWHYFVDAETGNILKQYNHVMMDGPVTGSGIDLFDQTRNLNLYQIGSDFLMADASKEMFDAAGSNMPQDGKGIIYTLDARNADSTLFFVTSNDANTWTTKSAVSASANGALVYDFFRQVFNRNAIDGKGSSMNIVVNYNQNFNNAFWNGQLMVFGNGDGSAFSDLAAALDVTAHEMSHGVVERTANLVYENQSGALNESFADVFGVLFEFWVKGESANWFLGEDVTTPNIADDALRNMENPGAANVAFNGQQPTKMSEFRNLANTPQEDNGGVHINSGIPNRAFFLFANNPAVGRDKAGEVYYQALTNYLTRNARFIDCRLAVLKAVDDVFGAGTPAATAAANAAALAFDTVEIFNGDSTPPPPTQDPVAGQEFLAAIEAETGLLYRYDPSTQEIVQISNTGLYSRPSVTDDGAYILYVDDSNNVHVLTSDGSSDQQVTSGGGFSNIAISPDGRFLAATSTFSEPMIYVLDLDDLSGAGDRQIPLYTPTTAEGTTAGNVLFPDRIDWASDNNILMYDAYNITVNATGDTTGYWDINFLRTSDGAIGRVFPPQPPGVDIGNAVFSSNSDNIIAFDYIDENQDVTVVGVNLNSGATGEITFNFKSLASPTFSNDDRKVYYHFIDDNGTAIWSVDLQEDGISGIGNDQGLFSGGISPVSYTVGSRPTGVTDKTNTLPSKFALLQNYPNPFNPSTSIQYELPTASEVILNIFDITGRLVIEIDSGYRQAGNHTVVWDGRDHNKIPVASGVYFYKLSAKTSDGKFSQLINKMTLLK